MTARLHWRKLLECRSLNKLVNCNISDRSALISSLWMKSFAWVGVWLVDGVSTDPNENRVRFRSFGWIQNFTLGCSSAQCPVSVLISTLQYKCIVIHPSVCNHSYFSLLFNYAKQLRLQHVGFYKPRHPNKTLSLAFYTSTTCHSPTCYWNGEDERINSARQYNEISANTVFLK